MSEQPVDTGGMPAAYDYRDPAILGITPPVDSEAVERVREAIATAERTESISATIRIDDLRALLNLAKPVGGEADEEARAERIKAAALTAMKEDDRG